MEIRERERLFSLLEQMSRKPVWDPEDIVQAQAILRQFAIGSFQTLGSLKDDLDELERGYLELGIFCKPKAAGLLLVLLEKQGYAMLPMRMVCHSLIHMQHPAADEAILSIANTVLLNNQRARMVEMLEYWGDLRTIPILEKYYQQGDLYLQMVAQRAMDALKEKAWKTT